MTIPIPADIFPSEPPSQWDLPGVRQGIRYLNTLLIQRRALRFSHLFPDLALAVLAHHVSEYSNAVLLVLGSEVPGTAYPLLRAAFEAHVDIAYLANGGEAFGLEGSRAYVASLVADYHYFGLQCHAAAAQKLPVPQRTFPTLRERLRSDVSAWNKVAPGRGRLLLDAHKLIRQSRKSGLRHWTGLSRGDLHDELERRLKEPAVAVQFRWIYDQMATRSHSGVRLGPYVETSPSIRIVSKPAAKDPFPLQLLGNLLWTTSIVLARFFVANPVNAPNASA